MNNTAIKIRKRRNELEYSQEYMAIQLEISQPAYARIESGDTKINIRRLEKIAQILAVDIIDLLDSDTTVNNFNNNAENTYSYGMVYNLYNDNKEYIDKIISHLESDKALLEANNSALLKLIEEMSSKQ